MHKFPCAVRRALFAAMLVVATLNNESHAVVTVIGDVLPADNISTPTVEGIPSSGNGWNFSRDPDDQDRWETNQEIIVGKSLLMGGRLDMDTSSNLRYTNLIIGDRDDDPDSGFVGTGTVLITGRGTLFSNNPLSLPPNLPSNYAPTPAADRPDDVGFDLWVGRWGQGRFELRDGGRAEIQDAVIIGDNPGSSGVAIVDGFGSLLGSGGFEATSSAGEPHQMIVGRQGSGQLYITDGGLVVSEGPQATGDSVVVAAVIGSDPFDDTQPPVLGGNGTVLLSGNASRWIVGGSLQIGGFHNATQNFGDDIDGDSVIYSGSEGQAGSGTLIAELSTQVIVRAAIGATEQDELLMAIGRFGTLDLRGGQVIVGGGVGGTQPQPTSDEVQTINDGVIEGYGHLVTGGFRNRYFGQVLISQGESLTIESTSEFGDLGLDAYPLINFGLVEVTGTDELPAELEFLRAPGTTASPLTPLINRPVDTTTTPAPTSFEGGLISARHATLRFHSGIRNEGSMIFTAGVNQISGRVDNITGIDRSNALVYIGPDTTVVTDNDFSSGAFAIGADPNAPPILALQRGSTLVVEGDLALAGFLDMELSFTNPSTIQVAGDVGLNSTLFASFDSEAMSLLSHGDAFELMYFAREIGGIDTTDPERLAPDLATNPVLNVATDANFDAMFPNLDLIAMPVLQSYYLFVRDPTMVGTVGASFADFNGDGIVDQADLAIWQANKGITSGASVLQGDADGDGDVDGEDYLKWLQQFTNGGVPGPGGSPSHSFNVPEPAGLAWLSIAALLALARRRRFN